MADLHAEQIMVAAKSAITGLTTTGSNVERGRTRPATGDDALSVYMGNDSPVMDLGPGLMDWDLEVIIEAHTRSSTEQIDSRLNQVRKEVHLAMMADHTLGLAFVIDVMPGPANEPELDAENNKPAGSQRIVYTVRYRASRNDLSA